ncbi:MAG: hypothetical protein U1C53_00530 [Candidatus Veblenbacteria bacterium]|nr:hypothetical protein [Candidatus Veblenbacteria bacterium]MDZ4229606.1 hypothetical protein [Candidatus Veblenbacteria bacterium]
MPIPNRLPRTKLLLSLLAEAGQDAVDFLSFMQSLRHYQSAFIIGGKTYVKEIKRLSDAKLAQRTLWNLHHQNYIKARRIGKRLIVSLTPAGRLAIMAHELSIGRPLPKGTFTVVAFDVPVTENLARRRFRLLLRQAGFIKLQQSIWLSEFDVRDRVANFIKQHKLERWVNVYHASNFLTSPQLRRISL